MPHQPCVGTGGNDIILGTRGDDVIHGLDGNDRINGLSGDDLICGGEGHDSLRGKKGRDRLFGGPGRDFLGGGSGNDELFGEAGDDQLQGRRGDDALDGGEAFDRCDGGSNGKAGDSAVNCETVINVEITGSVPPMDVTQIFTDLEPTPPREDEIIAPPVDVGSTFPPPGPVVSPGPPVIIDTHFWDSGKVTPEKLAEALAEEVAPEEPSAEFNERSPSLADNGRKPGSWREVLPTGGKGKGDVAIHAALLRSSASPSGAEILYFAGNAFTPEENRTGRVKHTRVYKITDPGRNRFAVEDVPTPGDPPADLFCSGHALLENGSLLVTGGTEFFLNDTRIPAEHRALEHWTAIRDSFVFNPRTNTWSRSFPMNFQPGREAERRGGGRWYPSLLTLNSGRVVAFWGHPHGSDTRHTNNTPEIFRPNEGVWEFLGEEKGVPPAKDPTTAWGYPSVYMLPNGRVFRATAVPDPRHPDPKTAPTINVEINPIPESRGLVDAENGIDEITRRVSDGPGLGFRSQDNTYASVMLPLTPAERYKVRILLAGGFTYNPPPDMFIALQPELIELDRRNVGLVGRVRAWRDTGKRDPVIADRARMHPLVTILPTGEVLVSGGKNGFNLNDPQTPMRVAEIYNPFRDTWRTAAEAVIPRDYHAVAVLMPDGRVWHAGSSVQLTGQPNTGKEAQEHRVDLYEPSYYTETRPVVSSIDGPADPLYPPTADAPRGAAMMHLHDSGVTVEVEHFRDNIAKFALVRASSVTHFVNTDQRYIELEKELVGRQQFSVPGSTVPFFRFFYRLTSPPSSSIAPPGNYLLFAIDDRGVPSVGRFIRIDRQFVGELTLEAEDVTFATPTRRELVRLVCLEAEASTYRPQDLFEYGGIDFGTQEGVVKEFAARICAHTRHGGTINVRLDRPDGLQIATLQIPPTDTGEDKFDEQTTSVVPVEGVHNIFISFVPTLSDSSASLIVDRFKFKQ
ncbi:MAG: galactose oxidase-like domain-containing protein [bacterium]